VAPNHLTHSSTVDSGIGPATYAPHPTPRAVYYRDKLDIQSLLRRFWALAYLPVISIGLMFPELKDEAAEHPVHSTSVIQYVDYIERQWMRNRAVPKLIATVIT